MNAKRTNRSGAAGRNGKPDPVCPFCFSGDSMEPFRRSGRVTLLSRIMPRLRWRYCRSCTRHFLAFTPKTTRT